MLNAVAILFAFLAAGFWIASASVKIPKTITMGWGGVGGTAQELGNSIRRAARLSGIAAAGAGFAALCQGVSLLMSVIC